MDAFTQISYPNAGDTSVLLSASSKSLYQHSTEVTIEPAEDVDIKPELRFLHHKDGSVFSIGSLLYDLVYELKNAKVKGPIVFNDVIIDMKFVCKGAVLLVLLADGTLFFVNFAKRSCEMKSISLGKSCSEMLIVDQFASFTVFVKSQTSYHVLTFPNYGTFLKADFACFDNPFIEFFGDVNVQLDFEGLPELSEYHVVQGYVSNLILFPKGKGAVMSVNLDDGSMDVMERDGGYGIRQVEKYGSMIVALTDKGILRTMDIFTGSWISEFDLRLEKSFDDDILHFKFIDYADNEVLTDLKLFLVVASEGKPAKVQIRSYPKNEVNHQVTSSTDCQVLPYSTDFDNVMIFIDSSFRNNEREVRIRAIYEAHPQARLEKLMNIHKFDEAEAFAKEYNLDLQIVYQSRVAAVMFDADDEEENQKILESAITYFDKIADPNIVGDICVAYIARLFHKQCLQRLFAYIDKKDISDEDTKLQLARCRYDFDTMCTITEEDSFDLTIWKKFTLDADFVSSFFLGSCLSGCIGTARLLWNRYYKDILTFLIETDYLDTLLELLLDLTLADPAKLTEVVEFVQHEFGPRLLVENESEDDAKSRGNALIAFSHKLVSEMEIIDPANFPDNSLMASQLMKNTLETVLKANVTVDGDARVFVLFVVFNVASNDPADPMGNLNICTSNLKKMLVLKTKYNCSLSYSAFLKSTPKSICFSILNKCKNIKTMVRDINKYAIPYIKDNRMKTDEVILDFISEVSTIYQNDSLVNRTWDSLYLAITGVISNKSKKCLSVIAIAKKASIPWSVDLKNVVTELLADKNIPKEMRKSLGVESKREELGNILRKYEVPLTVMDQNLFTQLSSMFAPMFYNSMHSLEAVKIECTRICELLEAVQRRRYDPSNFIPLAMANAAVRHVEESFDLQILRDVFKLLDSPAARENFVLTFVVDAKGYLNMTHKLYIEKRLSVADLALIVLANYAPKTDENRVLEAAIRNIRKIQEFYGVLVSFDEMTSTNKKPLEDYVSKFVLGVPKPPLTGIIRFGALLGFSKSKCCEIAVNTSERDLELYLRVLVVMSNEMDDLECDDVRMAVNYLNLICRIMSEVSVDPKLSKCGVQFVADNMSVFQSVIRNLYLTAHSKRMITESSVLKSALNFFSLFADILDCFAENTMETGVQVVAGDEGRSDGLTLYGMSSKLGIELPKDGGTLYDVESLVALMKVAHTIFTDKSLDISVNLDDWIDVYTPLLVNPYLNWRAHSLAFSLGALNTDKYEVLLQLCKKLLAAIELDLEMAVGVIFTLESNEIDMLLGEIGKWSKYEQNPLTMKHIAVLSQAVVMITGKADRARQIKQTYRTAYWLNCFSANDIPVGDVDKPEMVYSQICKIGGDPDLYSKYCVDYGLDANVVLLKYAFHLLTVLDVKKSGVDSKKNGSLAVKVLSKVNADPEHLLEQGQLLFDRMCPYNYEGAIILLEQMNQWVPNNDNVLAHLAVVKFLQQNPRKGSVIIEEVKWCLERTKRIRREDESLNSTDDLVGNVDDSITIDGKTVNLEKMLPENASNRLPMHILLSKVVYEAIFNSVISNEMTIEHVKPWLQFVKSQTNIQEVSRTFLIIEAVGNKLREVINTDSSLTKSEVMLISELLHLTSRKTYILQQLTIKIRKLPLCDSKITIIELLEHCGTTWFDNGFAEKEFVSALGLIRTCARKWKMELYLSEAGIVIVDNDLFSNVEDLVKFVFGQHTDWNDPEDIAIKFKLNKDLAEINEVDIKKILCGLVQSYFKGGDFVESYLRPVNAEGNTNENFISGRDLFLPLPYFEVDVVRLTYILNELNDKEITEFVAYQLMDVENTAPRLLRRLKVVCILIRHLNEEKLQKLFDKDIAVIKSQVRGIMVMYCFKVCGLGNYHPNDYFQLPAEQFVTTLIAGRTVKITRETVQLASAIVVDRQMDLKSIVLIEKLLKRLQQFRCFDSMKMLLSYISRMPNSYSVNNLSPFYTGVFDYTVASLRENGITNAHCFRDLFYFMVSCPMVRRDAFRACVNCLSREGMPNAANVLNALCGLPKNDEPMESSDKDIKMDENALQKYIECIRNQTVVGEHINNDSDGDVTMD